MQPSGESLIKQFSLDWLPGIKKAKPPERSSAPDLAAKVMDEALIAFSQPLLAFLRQQNGKARLFEILDGLEKAIPDVGIDNLRAMIRALEASNAVKTVERDRHGNDLVELTK